MKLVVLEKEGIISDVDTKSMASDSRCESFVVGARREKKGGCKKHFSGRGRLRCTLLRKTTKMNRGEGAEGAEVQAVTRWKQSVNC